MIPIETAIKKKLLKLVNITKGYKIAKPFYSGKGHILLFHRVNPMSDRPRLSMCSGLEVTPEYLESVIRFFVDSNYDIIPLDRLNERLRSGRRDKKFVVFSFDDGYRDNLTYAYPIFKKHQIPFTVYVTTGFIDRSAVIWWYLLEELLLGRDQVSFEIEGKKYCFTCSTMEEKENAFAKIRPVFVNCDENSYWDRIQQIFAANRIVVFNKNDELMLDWKGISVLSGDPLVTIGAHTVNHFCLSKLTENKARYEILEAKKILEARIGKTVHHFSYPFGDRGESGEREFSIIRGSGFLTASTGRSANIFAGHSRHLEALPRITMGESLDNQRLVLLANGFMHCRTNRFKRIVTE